MREREVVDGHTHDARDAEEHQAESPDEIWPKESRQGDDGLNAETWACLAKSMNKMAGSFKFPLSPNGRPQEKTHAYS